MEQYEKILDNQELNPVTETEVERTPEPGFPWTSLILLFLGIARLVQGRETWGIILLLVSFGSFGYYIYEKNKLR
jgi:hypothetical protein